MEPSRCWRRHFETVAQLTVDGFFRGCCLRPPRGRLRAHPRRHRPVPLRLRLHVHACRLHGVHVHVPRRPGRSGSSAVVGIAASSAVVGAGIERFVYRRSPANAGATALLADLRRRPRHRHRRRERHPPASGAARDQGLLRARQGRPTARGAPLPQLRRVAGGSAPSSSCSPLRRCCATRRSAARSRPPESTPTSPRRSASTPTTIYLFVLLHRHALRRRRRLLVRPASTRSTRRWASSP